MMNFSHAQKKPGSQRGAVVTGSSAGLGLAVATELLAHGYRVALVGRDSVKLQIAAQRLRSTVGGESLRADQIITVAADLTHPPDVAGVAEKVEQQWGRLDVLVNVVGLSDRGLIENLQPARLNELITANVTTTLLCCQSMRPLLEETGGVVVNIGSLAAKVGARYLGAYPAAKHALAGLTQQLRLEWKPLGIHVALVSPGPIRRDDAGSRYSEHLQGDADLPETAARPGGGTTVRGIDPQRVARTVRKVIQRRSPDVMLPGHLRPLVAIGHLWPRLGDWLLLRFTRSG